MNAANAIDQTLASTLDSLDEAVNYMRWIVDLARPYLADPILEVGAGHGTFTAAFAEIAAVHAVEPGEYASAILRKRFVGDERVRVTAGMVSDVEPGRVYSSAVMINVLEHIEDDVGALREIGARMHPGALIAIWVPAFQLLFSEFDRKLGHHRRYRKETLRAAVEAAGFHCEDLRYVNAPGYFSWFFITRLLGKAPTAGPLVRVFDRFFVPVIRRVESRFAPPFGQSIFIVGRLLS